MAQGNVRTGPLRLYVGFFSALDYWRGVSNLGDFHDNVQSTKTERTGIEHYRIHYSNVRRVKNPAFRISDIKDLSISLSPEAPLDVLVSDRKQLRPSQRVIPHVMKGKLPAHSFVEARDGVLVATPEATFVQLAQVLTLPQLLLVGMELCGTYLFDGSEEDGTGFAQRPRLLSVRRLTQYVSWCRDRDGLELAQRAVRLLMENSGSPRESVTVLALTLPNHLRGLGLPQPKLNHRTLVSKSNREGTSQSQYFYDFYWQATRNAGKGHGKETSRVDGEYDSDENHTGTLRLYDDARRRNSVQFMGTMHVSITNHDLQSARNLITIARQISRHIWHRLPTRQALSELEPYLDDLLDELKGGVVYPVSLDSDGKLPMHTRPAVKRISRSRHPR